MKHARKILALLLAVVMVMGLSITAFADEPAEGNNTGKITIDNAVEGQTYKIYKIFELESYNADNNNYAYKVTNEWKKFLEDNPGYVTVDNDYVTWVKDADAAAFAKAAIDYANKNNIPSVGDPKKAESTTVEFTGLPLGYYLVGSSVGSLCSLDTTNPEATIKDKNTESTLDKQVMEVTGTDQDNNPTGSWGDSNTANIGDTVYFKSVITVGKGAQGYVMHDKMDAGLTFDANSVSVTGNDGENLTAYSQVDSTATGDGCTFHVTFTDDFYTEIEEGDKVTVSYTATLNKDAVVGDPNKNEAYLKYGENSDIETKHDETETYTYRFGLVKTDDKDNVISVAKFRLYDAEENGNEIKLVKESDGVYRVTKDANEQGVEIEAGNVEIKGLDIGTYWLEETQAPAGYNKLTERQEVKIEGNNDAIVEELEVGKPVYQSGGVKVVNKSGTELPSTGGMGTTLFYIFGGLMMLGAVVLLVTRKIMSVGRK